MKVYLFFGLVCLTLIPAAPRYEQHTAYHLPAGSELLVGDVRTTFVCSNDGYYADQDNFCQIFHVCHTVIHPDGTPEMVQWSFFCGVKTIFNQFSLTCSYPEDAVPCGRARDFWYLNANLGVGPNVPFHNEQDVLSAVTFRENRTTHHINPQRVSHVSQVFRPSPPIAPVRPPPTRTLFWQPSPIVYDRPLPRRVLVSKPTTSSPFVTTPLRPHAMPLLLPPTSAPVVLRPPPRPVMPPPVVPRPPVPPKEAINLILNEPL